MDDLKYHLALFHAPGIGNRLNQAICQLLSRQNIQISEIFEHPGLLKQLILAQKQAADKPSGLKSLSEKKLQQLIHYVEQVAFKDKTQRERIETALSWQEQSQQNIILIDSPEYPDLLKQIDSPPPLLYVMGNPELLKKVQLAVVGSRNPTPSGKETAYQFSYYLAQSGMVITSGMALGIDTAAHQGSLDAKGHTIAVAGTGLDRIYPARNKALAHQIAEHGAIVSCFALGTGPSKGNFPKRNQIISGLSVGTLVVEAALQSGSLITARLAMEQGREVFAIPGSIHNPLARGCHALIRQGAKLVETSEDIAEEIINLSIASQIPSIPEPQPIASKTASEIKTGHDSAVMADQITASIITSADTKISQHASTPAHPAQGHPAPGHSTPNHSTPKPSNQQHPADNEPQYLLNFIDYDPISLDQLALRSQLAIDAISSMIVILELEGHIQTLPGGKICRCHH